MSVTVTTAVTANAATAAATAAAPQGSTNTLLPRGFSVARKKHWLGEIVQQQGACVCCYGAPPAAASASTAYLRPQGSRTCSLTRRVEQCYACGAAAIATLMPLVRMARAHAWGDPKKMTVLKPGLWGAATARRAWKESSWEAESVAHAPQVPFHGRADRSG